MTKKSPEVQMYALMGVCLLGVQQAERTLAGAVESVLEDRTLTANKLREQTEKERKQAWAARAN